MCAVLLRQLCEVKESGAAGALGLINQVGVGPGRCTTRDGRWARLPAACVRPLAGREARHLTYVAPAPACAYSPKCATPAHMCSTHDVQPPRAHPPAGDRQGHRADEQLWRRPGPGRARGGRQLARGAGAGQAGEGRRRLRVACVRAGCVPWPLWPPESAACQANRRPHIAVLLFCCCRTVVYCLCS